LARKGGNLWIVFITDGSASHLRSRKWSRAKLAACRKQEAIEALRRLGAANAQRTFFRLRDAAMPKRNSKQWHAAHARLEDIIRSFRPDLALLPWRRDPHCDHRASWCLANSALKRAFVFPTILEYAIWLDELGAIADRPRRDEACEIHINIASTIKHKRRAVAAHRSQISDLIDDDPQGFRLGPATIARLTGSEEKYWLPCNESD
jgi:LmbE family N-acetylglucosaminyl deacetylase